MERDAFALLNLEGSRKWSGGSRGANGFEYCGKVILTRLSQVSAQMTKALDAFEFDEACRIVYGFFWGELCDWYIELAKPAMNGTDPNARKAAQTVLAHSLDAALRMLHPFMPFITEELWQLLPLKRGVDSIMIDSYPERDEKLENPQAAARMELLMDVIKAVRTIRGESRIGRKRSYLPHKCHSKTDSRGNDNDLNRFRVLVRALAK
jgi:valyl-tRNA synthetase